MKKSKRDEEKITEREALQELYSELCEFAGNDLQLIDYLVRAHQTFCFEYPGDKRANLYHTRLLRLVAIINKYSAVLEPLLAHR